jgi:hypothetical protein
VHFAEKYRTPVRNEGKAPYKHDDDDEEDFELFGGSKSAKKQPEGEASARRSEAILQDLIVGIFFKVDIFLPGVKADYAFSKQRFEFYILILETWIFF